RLNTPKEMITKVTILSPPVDAEEWKASVVSSMDALVDSCVVVPCSFSHPKETLPTARLRGLWHLKKDRDQLIYSADETRVLENFRGRTQLLGELGKGNCSLKITNIKSHDNGPFCFRIELARTETDTQTKDKFSFVEDCVTLDMMSEPNAPSLTHKDPIQGRPFTITCSVMHTCPTNKPEITWSRGSADDVTESHREIQRGLWEISSVLTFIPAEKDSHQDVTCTALFQGRITSSSKMTLYVRRSENYNYIIIPVVVALGSAAIFGGLCFLMVKKYKKRIEELQRQDGT
uniref:Ig-like domain-containing protein n=1 Tax=Neogobius melanostomus TaxID=47308 RepID=A0A8C6SN47_9GOBI